MLQAVLVFVFALLIDVLYVFWFMAITEKKRWWAALMSVMLGGCALFSVGSVIRNTWMAIPYLVGLGIGTVIGMALKDRLDAVQR